MVELETLQVSNNPNFATPIAAKGDVVTLFSNQSPTATIYISDSQSFNITSNNLISLSPGGFVVVAPQSDLYAATNGISGVNIEIIPGGQSFFQLVNLIVKTLVINSPAGGESGIFVYNGIGAPGNQPILSIESPGVTTDPYGNPVSPVLNIGPQTGAHSGFDSAGRMYFTDSGGFLRIFIDPGVSPDDSQITFYNTSGKTILQIDGTLKGFFQYQDLGATQGQLLTAMASVSTTDPIFGHTVSAGFTTFNPAAVTSNTIISSQIIEQQISGDIFSLFPIIISSVAYYQIQGAGSSFFKNLNGCLVGTTPPSFSTPETWHTLSLNAGFAAFGSPFSTPSYRFEPTGTGGIVRLAGVLKLTANEGSGTTIATVPSGYFPAHTKELLGANNLSGGIGSPLQMDSGGNLLLNTTGTLGNFVSLDGITYDLDL